MSEPEASVARAARRRSRQERAGQNAGWDAFKRLPLYGRVLLVALAGLVLLEFAGTLVQPLGGGEAGQSASSAYSTKDSGLAAYAQLLRSADHAVTLERESIDRLELAPDTTLIVAGVALTKSEAEAAAVFVENGGRLIAAGSETAGALRRIVDRDIRWVPAPTTETQTIVPVPETDGVDRLETQRGGWNRTGPALPVVGDVAAVASVGRGRVVLLADPTPLQNMSLAAADNAAFGLAIAGPPSRPVLFAEAAHVGRGTGLAAIPSRWKWALLAGGIAAILAMWSAGRRFGPPEEEGRDLPPPRRAYVDAMAATLAKSRQPEASLAPLRAAARERLIRRAALSPDASDAQVRQAAIDLGLAPDEVAALFGVVTGDEDAMAVGRAMARLGGTRW
jgi:hypothetical protein